MFNIVKFLFFIFPIQNVSKFEEKKIMKLIITTLVIFLFPFVLKAQQSNYTTSYLNTKVYSMNFTESLNKLKHFIKTNNIIVENQLENKKEITVEFFASESVYLQFDSLCSHLGFTHEKNIITKTNKNIITGVKLEIEYLTKLKKDYGELMKDLTKSDPKYLEYWNLRKDIDKDIFQKKMTILQNQHVENIFKVSIKIFDETITSDNSFISFVNMPGIEYSYLSISSPKTGISAKDYQGYFIKYLFTKGKSFGTLGLYRNEKIEKTDELALSELFTIGFGQDFYSRVLGRGSRKFFNLYTGYTIGGITGNGKESVLDFFYITPSLGLELIKTKHIILDSKVNYFIPFKENKNLRGISYNVSFNFVF